MSGETSGTAAKTYTAIFSLKDTTLYEWSDGTNTPKSVECAIEKPQLLSLLHFDDENDPFKDECGNIWQFEKISSDDTLRYCTTNVKFNKEIQVNSNSPGTKEACESAVNISPTELKSFTMDCWVKQEGTKG